MNDENLKTPSASEARERGQKGGQASGRSRKRKAEVKKIVNDMLNDVYTTKSGERVGLEIMLANLFKIATDSKSKQCIPAMKMLLEIYSGNAKDKLLEKKIKAEIKALEAKAKAYSGDDDFNFEEEIPMLYKALETDTEDKTE